MSVPRGQNLLNALLIALALAWGIAVHWPRLLDAPLAIDEHVSFWIADSGSPGTILERSLGYSATPPLLFVVQRACLSLLGRSEWALRLAPYSAYLAAIVAVGWYVTRSAGGIAGGLAALLLAAHPAVGDIAIQARPYGPGLLLSICALAATERLCEGPHSRRMWALWVAVNLLLVQTHYLFALIGAPQLIWLATARTDKKSRVRTTTGAALALALIGVSCLPGMLHILDERRELNWTTHVSSWRDLQQLIFPMHWVAPGDPVWWGVVLAPAALAAGALIFSKRNRGEAPPSVDARKLWRWTMWSAVPILLLWGLGRCWLSSLSADRYLVAHLPALAGVAGVLLARLPGCAAALGGTFACLALWGGGDQLASLEWTREGARAAWERKYPADTSWKKAAEFIDTQTPPPILLTACGLTEMVLVTDHFEDRTYHDYVSCRLGRMYLRAPPGEDARRISLPLFWDGGGRIAQAYRKLLDEELARKPERPLWLVAATDTDLLRATTVRAEQLLASMGLRRTTTWEQPGVIAVQFTRPP